MSVREQAMDALVTLVTNAYPWTTPPSRRLVLWADCPKINRPQAFLFGGAKDTYNWNERQGILANRDFNIELVIYIDATPPNEVGSVQIDNILDALDDAFAANVDLGTGRNSLGGIVHTCRFDGGTFKDPGDLDNDGMIWAHIKMILP
jgi:hypothetical protein